MKPVIIAFLSFLFVLFAPCALPGQQNGGPHVFHYAELVQQLGCLNKRAVEHIGISGDGSADSDQKMLDTLRLFLQDRIESPGNGSCKAKAWLQHKKKVKNITIRNAGWKSLPEELGSFDNLYELVLINCPSLNLQVINDQLNAADRKSKLFTKFHEEIVSITFSDTDFGNMASCNLSKELIGDLRELRFVRIANFSRHCDTLLQQLLQAYPKISWLTMESCQLTDDVNLAPLDHFEHLIALSLANNYLTQIPYFNTNLKSVDLSFNLIGDFRFREKPDSNYLDKLEFIFLECNLFNYYKLTSVYFERLFDHLEVFAYDCNCDNRDEYGRLSAMFDLRKVATYMTYPNRYTNDFNPDLPNCNTCNRYRNSFISGLLQDVILRDSNQTLRNIKFNSENNQHISLRQVSSSGGSQAPYPDQMFSFKKLTYCKKNTAKTPGDNWDWEIKLQVNEINTDVSEEKEFSLVLKVEEALKTGTVSIEALAPVPER